jgi:hypothetical protein
MADHWRVNTQEPRRSGFARASLILGVLGLPTVGLAVVGAMVGLLCGIVGLVKASNAPSEYGGKGMALVGLILNAFAITVMPFVIGLVAAIVIPSLLRARAAQNEVAVLADLREVAAAESRYKAADFGYYDDLGCLAKPSSCVPGYRGPAFLKQELTSDTRHGYRFVLHAGPAPEPLRDGASRSSMTSFALVAEPLASGPAGTRSFCADATGRVCYRTAVSLPDVLGGRCPASCAAPAR